jgi:Bacterial Ig domain
MFRLGAMIRCGLATVLCLMVAGCSHPQPGVLPLGNFEGKPGATVTGVMSLQGWAAAEKGVSKVCLYVDRQPAICTENITGLRPDVAKVYPNIAGAETSGWNIQFDSSGLSAGDHELVIQATTRAGATRDLGSVVVNVAR